MVQRVGGRPYLEGLPRDVLLRCCGLALTGGKLAWQIGRENCVGSPTVDVTKLIVVMVCFRVNVDQRDGQHPGRQPRQNH